MLILFLLFYTLPISLIVCWCAGVIMIINATSSVSLAFTCSWTLDWAVRCRLFCDIGLAFRTEHLFFILFSNL